MHTRPTLSRIAHVGSSRPCRALAWACTALAMSTGGSAALASSQATFPLRSAMISMLRDGMHKLYGVTGSTTLGGMLFTVTGNAFADVTPEENLSTFAGQPALRTTLSVAGTIHAGDQALDLASLRTMYFSPTYGLLGYEQGGPSPRYCMSHPAGSYPAQVKIGDSGTIVVYRCHADRDMAVPVATETLKYEVHPAATAHAALVHLTSTRTALDGQFLALATNIYRIDAVGNLGLLSTVIEKPAGGSGAPAHGLSRLELRFDAQ